MLFDKIILTCLDGSIDMKGNFNDKYLNISSKDTKYIEVAIFLGRRQPEKIKKNIILLKTNNN